MKSSAAATILSLLATIVQAAPAPVPQTTYNLNPYSRSCGAYLLAAAGVSAFASAPIDFQVHSIGITPLLHSFPNSPLKAA